MFEWLIHRESIDLGVGGVSPPAAAAAAVIQQHARQQPACLLSRLSLVGSDVLKNDVKVFLVLFFWFFGSVLHFGLSCVLHTFPFQLPPYSHLKVESVHRLLFGTI